MNELALFAGAGGGILGAHLLGWRTVCAVDRVVDGLAHRMDRLKALGNGQVASVVPFAWHQLRAKAGI